MDKINEELQNLRSRHDQLLSQIDESQNQDTVMELKLIQSIPTMRNRGYAKNEEDFPSEPLERLDRLMVENKIMIHTKNQACSPTILSVYEQLLESFKNTLKGPEARK